MGVYNTNRIVLVLYTLSDPDESLKREEMKIMTCPKCSSNMFKSSLNYETNGMDNFSVIKETFFYKCPICGYHQFMNTKTPKRKFVFGQKIKGVPVADE
jgi:predicted nucleic-acid-binding Zn-ribbon protein